MMQHYEYDGERWQPIGEPFAVSTVSIPTTVRHLVDGELFEPMEGVRITPLRAVIEALNAAS